MIVVAQDGEQIVAQAVMEEDRPRVGIEGDEIGQDEIDRHVRLDDRRRVLAIALRQHRRGQGEPLPDSGSSASCRSASGSRSTRLPSGRSSARASRVEPQWATWKIQLGRPPAAARRAASAADRQLHRSGRGRRDPAVEEDRAMISGAVHRHEQRRIALERMEIMVRRGEEIVEREGHRPGYSPVADHRLSRRPTMAEYPIARARPPSGADRGRRRDQHPRHRSGGDRRALQGARRPAAARLSRRHRRFRRPSRGNSARPRCSTKAPAGSRWIRSATSIRSTPDRGRSRSIPSCRASPGSRMRPSSAA